MQNKNYLKSFPADVVLKPEIKTFLTNNKLDAGVYGLLLEKSKGIKIDETGQSETITRKKDLKSVEERMDKLSIKSKQTYYNRLKKLIDAGYVKEITYNGEEYYWLPRIEYPWYFQLPLRTLSYLFMFRDTSYVFKTFIYIGRQFEIAERENQQYTFTLVELGEHIGMKKAKTKGRNQLNNSNNYRTLWYALYALQKVGLINIEQKFKNDKPYFLVVWVEKDIDIAKPKEQSWTTHTGENVTKLYEADFSAAMLKKATKEAEELDTTIKE